MQFWKPHALARPHADQLDLRMGDRVRTIVDLPTVVAGTEGKVILANGFNWQRYRVRFPGGVEVPDLDQRTHRTDRPCRQAPRQASRPRRRLTVGRRFCGRNADRNVWIGDSESVERCKAHTDGSPIRGLGRRRLGRSGE